MMPTSTRGSTRSRFTSLCRVFVLACACASTVLPLGADAADVRPGEYLAEGGWGMLHVTRGEHRALSFAIDSRGANAHLCSVQGGIVANRAVLEDMGDDRPCEITFVAHRDAVDVVLGEPATCRGYCGMRAGFDGTYMRPANGCRTDQRLKSAAAFKKSHVAADYGAALRTLQPVLTGCIRWLDARAQSRLIEDIAITQYHLGRFDDCLKTLEPLRADSERSEAELQEVYIGQPSEVERVLAEGIATRTNLALCRQASKTPSPL